MLIWFLSYKGTFKNHSLHGYGKLSVHFGLVTLEGEFIYGKLNGYGKKHSVYDGFTYVGNYQIIHY